MDIGISGDGFEGLHERVEGSGDDVLSWDRLDVSLGPSAGNGSAVLGTALRGWPGEGRRQRYIGAEEHKDAAGIPRLTKMDVSLRHRARLWRRRAHIRVSQLVVNGPAV